MANHDIGGKTVLITGASRGIGAAAARAFVAGGANVALTARSVDALSGLALDFGDQALVLPCDVSDAGTVQRVVNHTIKHFGGVDVLIGNAGMIDPISPLSETDPDAFSRLIDVNLKGVFNGMRAVLPHMQARGAGTVITVSSGAAHGPIEGWSAYTASKAGAYMLTRMAHLENQDKGIRVLGLSPGTVATQMQREIKASGINRVSQLDWADHIPPEWAAAALMWMCTTDADDHLGADVSLREEDIRRAVGLI